MDRLPRIQADVSELPDSAVLTVDTLKDPSSAPLANVDNIPVGRRLQKILSSYQGSYYGHLCLVIYFCINSYS